jgi:hypothetical protein
MQQKLVIPLFGATFLTGVNFQSKDLAFVLICIFNVSG